MPEDNATEDNAIQHLRRAGLTYRQIDHAARTGLVNPKQTRPHTGRLWTSAEATTLATLFNVWPTRPTTQALQRRRQAHHGLETLLKKLAPDTWPDTIVIGPQGQIGWLNPDSDDVLDHLETGHVTTLTPLNRIAVQSPQDPQEAPDGHRKAQKLTQGH